MAGKKTNPFAAMHTKKTEKKETPKMEKKESKNMEKMEKKTGIEKFNFGGKSKKGRT